MKKGNGTANRRLEASTLGNAHELGNGMAKVRVTVTDAAASSRSTSASKAARGPRS